MKFPDSERSSRLLSYDPTERLAIDATGVDPFCDRRARDRPVPEATCERFYVEVVGIDGRAANIELRVRLDTVEVGLRGRLMAIFDLDALREWWESPEGPFQVDQVTWTVDYFLDVRGRPAITLPTVEEWALSPQDQLEVARRLNINHLSIKAKGIGGSECTQPN